MHLLQVIGEEEKKTLESAGLTSIEEEDDNISEEESFLNNTRENKKKRHSNLSNKGGKKVHTRKSTGGSQGTEDKQDNEDKKMSDGSETGKKLRSLLQNTQHHPVKFPIELTAGQNKETCTNRTVIINNGGNLVFSPKGNTSTGRKKKSFKIDSSQNEGLSSTSISEIESIVDSFDEKLQDLVQ